jgi:hypothetical protein
MMSNDRSYLNQDRDNARRDSGRTNMAIGGGICLLGIVVTLVTYTAASDGGGTYVVAWGAIIFGAVRSFRGLASMS